MWDDSVLNVVVVRVLLTVLCKCSMNKQTNERTNSCITVHNYMKHGGEKLKPLKRHQPCECVYEVHTYVCFPYERVKKHFPRALAYFWNAKPANNLFMKLIFGPVNFCVCSGRRISVASVFLFWLCDDGNVWYDTRPKLPGSYDDCVDRHKNPLKPVKWK